MLRWSQFVLLQLQYEATKSPSVSTPPTFKEDDIREICPFGNIAGVALPQRYSRAACPITGACFITQSHCRSVAACNHSLIFCENEYVSKTV